MACSTICKMGCCNQTSVKSFTSFDEHGDACVVPTDGLCYTGFEPGIILQPGIRLGRGTASQIESKVYMRGNSTNGSNQGNIVPSDQFDPGNIEHLAQFDPDLA